MSNELDKLIEQVLSEVISVDLKGITGKNALKRHLAYRARKNIPPKKSMLVKKLII